MIQVPPELKGHFVGMQNASKWKYLISTDGHTASSRLGHLLGINSVVLKERSPWIEYYYPALKEGEDHLEFDIHKLVHMLNEIRVRSMARGHDNGSDLGVLRQKGPCYAVVLLVFQFLLLVLIMSQ